VYQISPFQIKQMLKDLISFAKFRYGRGVMVPYWVGQSPIQGMFPKKTLSRSCNEYEVDLRRLLGIGLLTYQGLILPHLWVPLWRVCCILLLQCNIFPSPLLPFIYYNPNIEFYVQWKVKSTTMPFEVRNTLSTIALESKRHRKCIPPSSETFINYVFSFLKGPLFLWRSTSFLSGP
jgi:hypothetical protein